MGMMGDGDQVVDEIDRAQGMASRPTGMAVQIEIGVTDVDIGRTGNRRDRAGQRAWREGGQATSKIGAIVEQHVERTRDAPGRSVRTAPRCWITAWAWPENRRR